MAGAAGRLLPLAVVSYNIHRCLGKDGRQDPERIAHIISELDPDIIALQEIESRLGQAADVHQLSYLAEATGLAGIAGPTLIRSGSYYGNALLTRHRIEDIRHLDLSVLSGQEPRGALDVDLHIAGLRLRVVATHFGLNARERCAQTERLLAALANPGLAADLLILMGDINEWRPLSQPLRRLNAWLGRVPAPPTFPVGFPLLALDRIWVRPEAAQMAVSAHKTPLTRIASDHLPLLARLEVPTQR